MKNLIALITGILFALGLGISGMTQTHVVKGFLDLFGSWNPSLVGVMVGAIAINAIVYQLIKNKSRPLLGDKFYLPTSKHLDKNLIIGAAIFGLGWGWAGICPGPGIVSLASGKMEFMVFVGSMIAGMYLFRLIKRN